MVNTLLHEILHNLLFNDFDLYKNKNGILSGPEVIREGRAHFGCPNYKGIELERDRKGQRRTMHEETIHYGDDIEVAMSGQSQLISRLVLAALKDSGKFEVDYNKAGMLKYGYKQGCSFLEKTFCDYKNYPQYFCSAD